MTLTRRLVRSPEAWIVLWIVLNAVAILVTFAADPGMLDEVQLSR